MIVDRAWGILSKRFARMKSRFMLLVLRSVLKQRVNIQFCILNESSATRKLTPLVPFTPLTLPPSI